MITLNIEEGALIDGLITKSKICYVSMVTPDGLPYVIPMNFGFKDDILYMHSGPESTVLSIIENNPNLCILFCSDPSLVYQHEEVACSYRMKGISAICRGKVNFIEDSEQKIEVLNIIMKQYTDKEFKYSDPAIKNVKIWKIPIESVSAKVFGAMNPKSPHYKNQDFDQYY